MVGKARPMLFYPAMKQLTLDLAATSFLGTPYRPRDGWRDSRLCGHGRGDHRTDP
jgi:hypothetical protein